MANELFGLIEGGNASRDYIEAMIDQFLEVAMQTGVIPRPEKLPAKKREPIERLEKTGLDYGKYCGQPFSAVPLSYLSWLVGVQEDSIAALKEYLTHPDLRLRRGGELTEIQGSDESDA